MVRQSLEGQRQRQELFISANKLVYDEYGYAIEEDKRPDLRAYLKGTKEDTQTQRPDGRASKSDDVYRYLS